MIWLFGGDKIQRGSRQLQLGQSGFQGGERLEDSWVRGRGESREDEGGGETASLPLRAAAPLDVRRRVPLRGVLAAASAPR